MTEKQLNMRKLGMEACYLASCALHGTVARIDENWDLEKLYKFCKFHSITSIVAMALEEVWREHPAAPEIMKKWRQARDKAIRRNVLLNAERERILAHLESIQFWKHHIQKNEIISCFLRKFQRFFSIVCTVNFHIILFQTES